MPKQFRENVEIISSASGQSGLKLVNLPSGTAQTTYNGLLGLDASGNVIKIDATTIATVTVGPTAPSAPVSGQQWLDTSLTPSELKVYNGTSWELAGDEVQHYANLAAFPATGDEDILYVDDSADIVYVWDSTTSAYVNASGTGAGLFTITDGTTSQSIGVGNTLHIIDTNLIKVEVFPLNMLTIGIDTTGATIGQTPSFDGTNVVWATPLSENIYTDDGTITDPLRTVSFDDVNNTIRFDLDSSNGALVEAYNSYSPIEILYPWGNRAFIEFGTPFPNEHKSYVGDASGDDSPYTGLRLECLGGQAGDNNVILNSTFGNYILETAPTANNNASNVLVLGTDNRIQTRNINTISAARYANTWTPVANVETVHTHALGAGEDIQIQVRDATTKEIVDVEIRIISATTFGVTSTTADPLRVIAL